MKVSQSFLREENWGRLNWIWSTTWVTPLAWSSKVRVPLPMVKGSTMRGRSMGSPVFRARFRGPGGQVGKIGLPVLAQADMNARTIHPASRTTRARRGNGGEFQIGVQPVEGDKFAVAVRFADGEIADICGHGERIDAYLPDADLTVQGGRNFFDKHVAGDARQQKKSEGGIKGHAAGCHGKDFCHQVRFFQASRKVIIFFMILWITKKNHY
jgi:hypothetical protein